MKYFRFLLYPTLLLLLSNLFFHSCKSSESAQTVDSGTYRAAFYNVENLFDTLDHPTKLDEEYTPTGKKHWNTERYFDKLNKLSRVVAAMEYPSLLGLCEIENEAVLKDFISETSLKSHDYQIVHFESPDERGIDNALIYKKAHFEVLNSKNIRIDFPKEVIEDDFTRDILYVKGKLAGNIILHIFVNHWPSRSGGVEKSEPKRVYVASALRKKVDEIFATSPNANILIMGDLNDETDNKSVVEILKAKTSLDNIVENSLYNCMAENDQNGKGSYRYRGNWNMLDNIIVSSSFVKPESKIRVTNATVFQEDWMMYDHPKYGNGPSRSYGGPNYYGGYSDHLPVFIDIVVE
jgi:predicted extracellular nuclease